MALNDLGAVFHKVGDEFDHLIEHIHTNQVDVRDALTFQLLKHISKVTPKQKRILFISNGGFSGSLKYAYLELRNYFQFSNAENIELWWLAKNEQEHSMLDVHGVNCLIWDYQPRTADFIMRSSVALCATHLPVLPRQNLLEACLHGITKIQLWHGIPAKEVSYPSFLNWNDIHDYAGWAYDVVTTDYMVCESQALKNTYERFFPFSQVLPLGSSRASYLYNQDSFLPGSLINVNNDLFQLVSELKSSGKIVLLYAPTYRESKVCEEIVISNLPKLIDNICKQDNFVLLIKAHPGVLGVSCCNFVDLKFSCPDKVFLVDAEEDILPYLKIADILISDYSSTMYDYLVLDRPIVLFQPDYYEYIECRNLSNYDVVDQYPLGPSCFNPDDIVSALDQCNGSDYVSNRRKLASFFHVIDLQDNGRRLYDFVLGLIAKLAG